MSTPQRIRPTGNLYSRVLPAGAVYVGRGTRFGNPHKVDRPCVLCSGAVHTLTESRDLFRAYLAEHPGLVVRARAELAGRDLACWCKLDTAWCHGDDWVALANR